MKRIKANDPFALRQMGTKHYLEEDYESAFKFYTKAAGLGDVDAHYQLAGLLHREGQGVAKDKKMKTCHLEDAAIGGHPDAIDITLHPMMEEAAGLIEQ